MVKFDMHIVVPAKMIGTIVELLAGEGILVSVSPCTGHSPTKQFHNQAQSPRLKVPHRRVSGDRQGNNGRSIVLTALKTGPKSITTLESLFTASGRAANSVSPILSGLTQANQITVDRVNRVVTLNKESNT